MSLLQEHHTEMWVEALGALHAPSFQKGKESKGHCSETQWLYLLDCFVILFITFIHSHESVLRLGPSSAEPFYQPKLFSLLTTTCADSVPHTPKAEMETSLSYIGDPFSKSKGGRGGQSKHIFYLKVTETPLNSGFSLLNTSHQLHWKSVFFLPISHWLHILRGTDTALVTHLRK